MSVVAPDPGRCEGHIKPHVRGERYELQPVIAGPIRRGMCTPPEQRARPLIPFFQASWFMAGRVLVRFLRVAVESNAVDQTATLIAELEFIR